MRGLRFSTCLIATAVGALSLLGSGRSHASEPAAGVSGAPNAGGATPSAGPDVDGWSPLPVFTRPSIDRPRADPYLTYRYETPAPPRQFFRAILEGLGVLSVGYVEYLVSTKQTSGDGRVMYDGSIFRDKLSGNAQSFDANQFGTNFIGHPLGGTLYYLSARSNRLSVAQSFAWAFTGSLFWEYLGEIQEKPSYNDMIATPWGGFANGEVFTQLASFFARGKPTFHGRALQLLFGTPRTVHDWVDDAEPERPASTDALGFPDDIWHDFRLSLGAGSTFQEGAAPLGAPAASRSAGSASVDARLALDLELKNLHHYGKPGKEARLFDDGNVASLRFRLGQSEGKVVDALYEARVTPLGYYVHDARVDERGRLRGGSGILGLSFGYEYGVHDYDRDRRQPVDVISKVTVLGLLAEYTAYTSGLLLRTRLDMGGDFGGVRSYALPSFLEQNRDLNLPYVLRNEGYYFAAGPSIAPRIDVEAGVFSASTSFRWDDFRGITGIDVDQKALTQNIPRSDVRVSAKARAAIRPVPALELAVEIEARRREGRMGDVRTVRTERTVIGSVGARF